MKRIALLTALIALIAAPAMAQDPIKVAARTDGEQATKTDVGIPDAKKGAFAGDKLLYTTYFYTAGEAIVHGYEKGTSARIISLEENRTVWQGEVGAGETKNIPTGRGVFGFVSDKKASILVGTPSSCTAVGYWLRDENGTFLSKRYYTELPSSISHADARVIVWAWKDTAFQVKNRTSGKVLAENKLKAGEFFELDSTKLGAMNSNVLEITAPDKNISVQVYYDEGFFVPSSDGRLAGKIFNTYVGKITEGSNDLNLINHQERPVKAKITDIQSKKTLWEGEVPAEGLHNMRLSGKYVRVTSAEEISVSVAPLDFSGYAEHHFAAGVEGTGIETKFINTTSQELWLFSYFDNNQVTVHDLKTEKVIWEGTLGAGHARGLMPGMGTYMVKSSLGTSVMGGSATCGAEYSPAGGMFRIDEELLKAAKVILEERRAAAAAEGRTLTEDEATAPLSASEKKRVRDRIKRSSKKTMKDEELDQRMESMSTY